MRFRFALLAGCGAALLLGLAGTGGATPTISVTVDFSSLGGAAQLDPLFFKDDGIKFAESYFTGLVQGDDAIISDVLTPERTIAGTFFRPVTSVSVRFALALQGTSEYSLAVYSGAGDVIASATLTVVETGATGYHDIVVNNLPSKAKGFSITGGIEFGLSSMTYLY